MPKLMQDMSNEELTRIKALAQRNKAGMSAIGAAQSKLCAAMLADSTPLAILFFALNIENIAPLIGEPGTAKRQAWRSLVAAMDGRYAEIALQHANAEQYRNAMLSDGEGET